MPFDSSILRVLAAAQSSEPGPMDYAGGLLADNAGRFSRTEPPVLFRDTPLAGSAPTYQDVMRQHDWLFNDSPQPIANKPSPYPAPGQPWPTPRGAPGPILPPLPWQPPDWA
jgi:hypothetical protein